LFNTTTKKKGTQRVEVGEMEEETLGARQKFGKEGLSGDWKGRQRTGSKNKTLVLEER